MPTQDELIQAELDGTIEELEAKADEQEAEETPEAEKAETVEQPTEEVKEEVVEQPKEEPKADTTTEKQSSVMKLLKQRNEARAEVEKLKAQAKSTAELEARLKELEEGIAAQELEKEAQKEKADFYEKYPSAK
jgi:chromosome segregation ATPase